MDMLISNDGTMYYKNEFEDYISSLGFNPKEVDDFLHGREYKLLKQDLQWAYERQDDYEEINDDLNSRMQCAAQEIEAIAEILRGRGGLTREQASRKLLKIIDNYLCT